MFLNFKADLLRLPQLTYKLWIHAHTCTHMLTPFLLSKKEYKIWVFLCVYVYVCGCCLFAGSHGAAQADLELVTACLSLSSAGINHTQHLHKYFPHLSLSEQNMSII